MSGISALPFGGEIAAALLAILAALLGIIARSLVKRPDGQVKNLSSEPVRGRDMDSLLSRVDECENRARQALTEVAAAAATRLDQHDRHMTQLIQSLSDNLSRQNRDAELEHRRQYELLMDKIDRVRADWRTHRDTGERR